MRVAHFGTFDVANYGDLLFPLVVEERLGGIVDEFVHVSPVGGPPAAVDGRPSVSLRAALDDPRPFDAVIIGGGHIVNHRPTDHAEYAHHRLLAFPDLWLGALELADRRQVPLVINSPGVRRSFGLLAPFASDLVSAASYVSVRDQSSAAYLGAAAHRPIRVVPDTALGLERLWSRDELQDACAEEFGRADRPAPERFVVFHVKAMHLAEAPSSVARSVGSIAAALDAEPVLIALGPCHGDRALAEEVASGMDRAPLIVGGPDRFELRALAAMISSSSAYVGSSLHGLITARAFGTPGVLVLDRTTSALGDTKFHGLTDQVGWGHRVIAGWGTVAADPSSILAPDPPEAAERLDAARTALDEHWTAVGRVLTDRPATTPDGAHLLRRPLVWRTAVAGYGVGWLARRAAARRIRSVQRRRSGVEV